MKIKIEKTNNDWFYFNLETDVDAKTHNHYFIDMTKYIKMEAFGIALIIFYGKNSMFVC